MNKTSKSPAWMFNTDSVENFIYCKQLFTAEECDKIIEIGKATNLTVGQVGGNTQTGEIRKSNVSWIYPSADTEWLYRKLTDAVSNLNRQFFNFDIYGIVEGLQFTEYEAPSGFYGAHIDKAPNQVIRKLSVSIQLTDEDEYVGGGLAFHLGKEPVFAPRGRGDFVMFPSYVLHEVQPVTSGTRHSLVAWVTGAAFK